MTSPNSNSDPRSAISELQAVKAEHRVILESIARDPGMAPETRWQLISHLYDEEDEHLAALVSGLTNTSPPFSNPTNSSPSPSLTVGSLRAQTHSNSNQTQLGSLRSQR